MAGCCVGTRVVLSLQVFGEAAQKIGLAVLSAVSFVTDGVQSLSNSYWKHDSSLEFFK